ITKATDGMYRSLGDFLQLPEFIPRFFRLASPGIGVTDERFGERDAAAERSVFFMILDCFSVLSLLFIGSAERHIVERHIGVHVARRERLLDAPVVHARMQENEGQRRAQ